MVAKKVCGTLALTSDLGSTQSPSQNSAYKDTAASFRVQVATAVYCVSAANNCLGEVQESFIWNEIGKRIGVRGNRDRLYAHNSLSHLVTHFYTS